MITRRSTLIGAAALALASLDARAETPSLITVRTDRDFDVLDPAFRSGSHDGNIIRAVYQRLYTIAPGSGELVSDAASALEQVTPTVVEFTLKPKQMFTRGFGEMTADDVKFSFERFNVAARNGLTSPYDDWRDLELVEVTGRYTGRIIMQRPRAALLMIGIGDVSGSIVCRRAVEELGVRHNTSPVGSGPLMVTSFEKQRGVTLERNPDYAGAQSGFEVIDVRYVPDSKSAELGLRTGELDFAVLPAASVEPLRQVEGLTIDEQPGIANVWIGLNTEKRPFNDIRVRRAFRLALDVDMMLLAGYGGRVARSNAMIMPQVLGYWKDAPVLTRDVARSKELLADAGFGSGFTCKILLRNDPVFQAIALVAQAQLAEAGIELEIDMREPASYLSAGKDEAGKLLDTILFRFNGKLDPNSIAQWYTTDQIGVWNWQRWSDPEFDALLEQASAELDSDKRAALMIKAQRRMEESEAFVWLTHDVTVSAFRSSLKPALLPSGIDWALDKFAPV